MSERTRFRTLSCPGGPPSLDRILALPEAERVPLKVRINPERVPLKVRIKPERVPLKVRIKPERVLLKIHINPGDLLYLDLHTVSVHCLDLNLALRLVKCPQKLISKKEGRAPLQQKRKEETLETAQ